MIEYFGYYQYELPLSERKKITNAALAYDLTLYRVRETEGRMLFCIPLGAVRHTEQVLSHVGAAFTRSQLRGLAGVGQQTIKHPVTLIFALFSVLLYIWLSGMVWEVRVVSRTDVDEDRILQLLAECGLDEGRRLNHLDEDEIVADYLMRDECIAFAAVHVRGLVVEVEVIPREDREEPIIVGEPCNIIALEDALITDITVYAGRALVKAGQTVKRGDILVSGVVTDGAGMRLVRASADVRGQRTGVVEATCPVSVTETVITNRSLSGVGVRIFGHTIFLGNKDEGGDTTADRQRLYLFNRIRLPIEVTRIYRYETEARERMLNTDEQRARAESMLEEMIEETLADGALLQMDKTIQETDDGVKITVQLLFENNIGKALAFDTEKQ